MHKYNTEKSYFDGTSMLNIIILKTFSNTEIE